MPNNTMSDRINAKLRKNKLEARAHKPTNFWVNITTQDGELLERISVHEKDVSGSFTWLSAEIKDAMEEHLRKN